MDAILSRTQLIKIPRLPDEEIANALRERRGADEQSGAVITSLAEGNWNEASRIMENDEAAREQSVEYLNWMRNCYGYDKKVSELMSMGDDFADKKREKQKMFFQYGLHITRECLMLNLPGNIPVRLNMDDKLSFGKFSQFIHPGNCDEIASALSEAFFHIERNANPRILFLDLSFKIGKLLKLKN
jgi:DNA polymerase-3 subunit delta'